MKTAKCVFSLVTLGDSPHSSFTLGTEDCLDAIEKYPFKLCQLNFVNLRRENVRYVAFRM